MKLEKASRSQVKLRIGLSGPSGYGKTYSALLLAYGITNDWSRIAIIDTENGSASLYSHLGSFNVLKLDDPFSPERYIDAINICQIIEGIDVIIIDSITHEWQGKGGCLQIHEQLGGRFQDWSKVSPRHQAFIDTILNSICHVITTTRRKVDYSLDTTQNGRTKVVKHGTKEITREGFEYELTLNLELINDKHLAKASKDRTGLFMDKPEFIINASTGRKLVEWCSLGVSYDDVVKEVQSCMSIDGLKHLYKKYNNLQKQIHPKIIKRKEELEALKNQIASKESIVKPTKDITNGLTN
ncbi:AAA family ATPase [Winogradskyella sp. SYSU M77433]|uniref:AAA family ATPase n=1 Tax=Winogradskyella sp. SYSU M77433 TaxID=3042722 RepID=UPI00248089ED|nr:AAA family ATPase [Winogradskyella sp. SYSU M77433]MDH7912084.1 AAA family ATPase [Winogradskyella sp. SYSU M77433]